MKAQRSDEMGSTRKIEQMMKAHLSAAYPVDHNTPDRLVRLLRRLDQLENNNRQDDKAND
jgi:hypothetical protein